ncbi:hypothetical protein L873DRAFT_1792907 [Choiromyces venosus 120613-1]|uniref:Uncharacterized protein n=1 Tax=Choiromyces venosus 120613-1 TaxID=1336337 RepID=A0A3N4JKQ0_9PEZI|nr:hypothetical protein L873DRAFT_1792907 [Choiromyces venosus 120613-1]
MAPSTASALNPIVIPAVQIPPHFTTLGSGLLHETHAREPLSTLTTLLLASPDIFSNKAKPKLWWRAQCLLYGLDAPNSLTVQSLREKLENALRRGELQIPEHLVELEHIENGKFRKLNAQVREATMGVQKKGGTGSGGGGAKKGKKEDLLKKVLGNAKVGKKASAAAAVVAAAPKPRVKKKPEPKVKPKTKAAPRAKAQAQTQSQSFATTTSGNIQIYLSALPPAPAPAPAPRAKQTAKRGTSSTASKPRAQKATPATATATAKRGGGPGSRGGRGGSRGGRATQPIKHEPTSPPPPAAAPTRGARTKQTARCSTRGNYKGNVQSRNDGYSTERARIKQENANYDSDPGSGGYCVPSDEEFTGWREGSFDHEEEEGEDSGDQENASCDSDPRSGGYYTSSNEEFTGWREESFDHKEKREDGGDPYDGYDYDGYGYGFN